MRYSYSPLGFSARPRRGNWLIALVIALIALATYYGSGEYNDITGETQRVSMTPGQEIALGLQAAPQMAQEFGGLDPNPKSQALVDAVGARLVSQSSAGKADWKYDFHVLADKETVNAFALPGGQVFITRGLLSKLHTEGQLAGVLGHEIGHVVARHGAQQLAKHQLTQGLAAAVGIGSGDYSAQQMAMMAGQMVNMRYGREDELESDTLGVRFMAESGYDPRSMLALMKILQEAGPRDQPPEFFSTHPNPENRLARIQDAIKVVFPEGVPAGLQP